MTLTVGGFTIGSASIPTLNYTDTLASTSAFQADFLSNVTTAMLAGGWASEGWSLVAASTFSWTQTLSNSYLRMTHAASGATLFLGMFGPWSSGGTYAMTTHCVNAINGGASDVSSGSLRTPTLLIAYAPPGVPITTAATGNPFSASAWFTDPRVFKFIGLGAESGMTASLQTPIEVFWGVKGNTFWLTRRYSTSAASTFAATVAAGQIIIPAESADTGALATYGLLKMGLNTAGLSSSPASSYEAQAYDLSGARKIFYTSYNLTPITSANATAPPWFTVPVQLSSTVIGEMRTGSGFKGTIDPAIVSACSTQVTARRRLGTDAQYTHLTSGLVLGYKTGSPAWG